MERPAPLVDPRDPNGMHDENDLSEQELRRLFEDEEIERFLGLFADVRSSLHRMMLEWALISH